MKVSRAILNTVLGRISLRHLLELDSGSSAHQSGQFAVLEIGELGGCGRATPTVYLARTKVDFFNSSLLTLKLLT